MCVCVFVVVGFCVCVCACVCVKYLNCAVEILCLVLNYLCAVQLRDELEFVFSPGIIPSG